LAGMHRCAETALLIVTTQSAETDGMELVVSL
jgi:hypothetical protein